MRIPRWLAGRQFAPSSALCAIRSLTATLAVIALMAVSLGPAAPVSASGIDGSLCASNSSRVEIPSDFPLRACFDGKTLFVVNDTEFVLRLVADPPVAGIATPAAGADVPGSIISMLPQHLNLMPPHFMMKLGISDRQANIRLAWGGDGANKTWMVMKLVLEYTPLGSASTLYSLAQELVDVTNNLAACLRDSGWVGDIGCRTGYAGNVTFAFGRADLSLRTPLIGALMGLVELALWSDVAAGQAIEFRHGTREFTIRATAPEPSASAPPSSAPPTSGPPSSASAPSPPTLSTPPSTSSGGGQNPTFTGGYVIADSVLGGTWPRTDPNDGTWYSRSNRPSNAASYWWANGLGVGFSCAARAASYSVNFSDGHKETWDTWLRSTDTWGGQVAGLWVPSAVADNIHADGIPPGMPTC